MRRVIVDASRGAALSWFVAMAALEISAPSHAESPAELRGHGGPVKAIAVSADGATLVSAGFDSALIVWDVARGSAKRVLRFHGSTVNALAILPGGCFASGGEDAKVAIWCGDGLTPARILEGHTAPITALSVSADGMLLASASFDRSVRVWSLSVPTNPPRVFDQFQAPLSAVAFLPGTTALAVAGYDGAVRIVPIEAGLVAPRPLMLGVPVNALMVRPDGGLMTAGADGHVRTLSAALEVIADIDLGNGPLTALAVTPDGSRLATAGMRTQVTMIDTATRSIAFDILGPGLPVWALTFSPDGRTLFTGGQDRAVRRWEAATGKPVGVEVSEHVADALPFPDERGAAVFKACRACHGVTPGDTAKAGPTLAGVFGRKIATAPGYRYSDALKALDIIWTADTIAELFVQGPMRYTPGTKMPEQTLTDQADRDALIAWLAKATVP